MTNMKKLERKAWAAAFTTVNNRMDELRDKGEHTEFHPEVVQACFNIEFKRDLEERKYKTHLQYIYVQHQHREHPGEECKDGCGGR